MIVNPSGVYGPGPSASVSFDKGMFEPLVRKPAARRCRRAASGWCYVEGLAAGHLLAADRGRDGERYILCDTHVSLRELAETVVRVAGRGRVPPTLPLPLARALAAGSEALSRVIRRPPLRLARPGVFLQLERASRRSQGAHGAGMGDPRR